MNVLALALLAIAALAPLALTLRRPSGVRGRRETALAVHRAQLGELDRDLADGRIAAAEHAQAVLEVQRRLLAAADTPEDATDDSRAPAARRAALLATLLLVPLAAGGLYLLAGHPELPAAPLAARLARVDQERMEAAALVATLRQRLTELDPKSELARQGYELLGNAEDGLGHLPQAAEAWRTALAIRFDPALAAELAEAQTRLDGHVSPQTASLFRQALAAAPADAPWRGVAEQRLSEIR